jgi:hypothetical protein
MQEPCVELLNGAERVHAFPFPSPENAHRGVPSDRIIIGDRNADTRSGR